MISLQRRGLRTTKKKKSISSVSPVFLRMVSYFLLVMPEFTSEGQDELGEQVCQLRCAKLL